MTSSRNSSRQVLFSADDFGMSVEINEAIEKAHKEGLLSTASLMVAGPAAADAVKRAKKLPSLNVGLHLVLIEGESCLKLPEITDQEGWFGRNEVKLGFEYGLSPKKRAALAKEIRAQFEAFSKTGLELDHANAHKHMHLHPFVGQHLIDCGLEHGLKAVRIPYEPEVECFKGLGSPVVSNFCCRFLRKKAEAANLRTNDSCFGIRWSGHMTEDNILKLLDCLPEGKNEIYFHPALSQDERMTSYMPGYQPKEELEALVSQKVKSKAQKLNLALATWNDF